jgi:excisionase family DNA binding protein
MSTHAQSEPLLDVRQAAELAGRAPETIRRWVWSGRLPAQRRGRKLLVARADVMRLAAIPAVEAPGLEEWQQLALSHLRSTSGPAGAHASAADLVLADRRVRESMDMGDDGRH